MRYSQISPAMRACLRVPGKDEFSIFCGPIQWTEKQMRREYKQLARAVTNNKIPDEDFQRIQQESLAYRDPEGFLAALYAKGILAPDEPDTIDAPEEAAKGAHEPN